MKKLFTCVLAVVMMAAMMLPVCAAKDDFVPSIEVKPGPSIVPQPGTGGTPSYGEIVMPDGTRIPLPEGGIVITPIGGKDNADEDTQKQLEDALKELEEKLEEIIKELFPDIDPEDIVITDIFHVDISGDYEDYLDEGGKIHVTLSPADGTVVSLQKFKDVWSALLGDNFIDNGDGTFTLIIDKDVVVALGKNVLDLDVDPENPGVSSPTTGEELIASQVVVPTTNVAVSIAFVIGGVLFAAAAVVFVVIACKKKA